MKGLLIFAAGLAIGAVAGAVLVKNKVLADAKAEIEEVRDYYRESRGKKEEPVEEAEEVEEVTEVKEEVSTNKTHVDYSKLTTKYTSVESKQFDDPFIIDPSEFGENPEYDTETLTYFADGVLIDDVDDVIDEPDIVVGLDNLKVFEEFGAASIYVRNDLYRTDYEILRDDWNYSDLKEPVTPPVKEKKPHQL